MPFGVMGTHRRPPGSTRRKVGTTSSHHAPYVLGCTRATMAGTMSCDAVRRSESQKAGLSSDWGLQLDPLPGPASPAEPRPQPLGPQYAEPVTGYEQPVGYEALPQAPAS